MSKNKYPMLSAGLKNLSIWIDDGEYLTIDLELGDEVSLGHVGYEEQVERYLKGTEKN